MRLTTSLVNIYYNAQMSSSIGSFAFAVNNWHIYLQSTIGYKP